MAQKSRGRAALGIAAVVIIVLAGAWFVFRHTLYTPPPVVAVAPAPAPAPVAPAAPAPPPVEDALVSAVVGDVQRLDASGSTTAVNVGDRLRVSDSLRTGKGARTDLEIGAGSKLTVGEGTQLTVREINNQVHRLKLTKGRITADYKGGERSLRIENEAGDTVAETKGARFSLLANGTSLAVATAEGAVDLTAKEKTVQVGAGQQAVAIAGEAPSAAEAIPAALLLKVADASAAKAASRELCAEVDGQAPAGTEVLIDGAPLAIARDGHFRVKVPRDPKDKRNVLVALRDAAGRETMRKVPCETEPEIDDMAIRWKRRKASP